MTEMDELYSVYIKTDASGFVAAVNSSAFLTDTEGWTKIDEGCGDKYHHAQGNYFPSPILTDSGVFRYKFVDGSVIERTEDEIEAEVSAFEPEPSKLDIIEAQVTYTAMMTDTLLTGV